MNDDQKDDLVGMVCALMLLIGLLVIATGCSASEVKGAVHSVGVPATATSAALIASGGNPSVAIPVLVATGAGEAFFPDGKDDAIRETVEALTMGEAQEHFAGRADLETQGWFTKFLVMLAVVVSLGYTYFRRRKAQVYYDFIERVKDKLG